MFVKVLKSFLFLLAMLLTLATLAYFSVFSEPDNKVPMPALNSQVAKSSEQLWYRIKYQLHSNPQAGQVFLTTQEANGLLALLHRSYHNVAASLQINEQALTLSGTLTLPWTVARNTLTFKIQVLPNEQRLQFGEMELGRLSLSGERLLKLAIWLVDAFTEQQLAAEAMATVRAVRLSAQQVAFSYQFDNADGGKGRFGRLMALRDQWQWFGDVDRVRFYHLQLLAYIATHPEQDKLEPYLHQMMTIAEQQCQLHSQYRTTEENRAALLALVLYFGSDKFELMLGEVSHLSAKQNVQRHRLIKQVQLAGRTDLQQHFIYSAALTLFADVPVSMTLGEFKELLDANAGGSGFSFVDLLADRAGTRFALLATQNEVAAQKIQHYFKTVDSADVMLLPDWHDLPEAISVQDFQRRYGSIDEPGYRLLLANLQQRLNGLALYQ